MLVVWRGSKVKATNSTESSLHVNEEATIGTGLSFHVAEPTTSTEAHVAKAIDSPGSPLQLTEASNRPGSSLQEPHPTNRPK